MLFQQILSGEAVKTTLTEVQLVAILRFPVEKAVEALNPRVVDFPRVFRIRDEEEFHSLAISLYFAQTVRNDAAFLTIHVGSKVVLTLYSFELGERCRFELGERKV